MASQSLFLLTSRRDQSFSAKVFASLLSLLFGIESERKGAVYEEHEPEVSPGTADLVVPQVQVPRSAHLGFSTTLSGAVY